MPAGDRIGLDAVPAALFRDPPPGHAYLAETLAQAIPISGTNLNAILYSAAGAGPHPTILLLHGLPGNEQNVDLAQTMRRAGWNVLTLHYRGSWGTPGSFSFAHCLEDAEATVTWLEGQAGVPGNRVDPGRLVLIGHSMGGYIASQVTAARPMVKAAALISPANIGSAFGMLPRAEAISAVDDNVGTSEGLHILAGTSPEQLASEVNNKADLWQLERHVPALATRPVLLITSDDGFAEGCEAFARGIKPAGGLTRHHMATNHSYSDHRIALQVAVLQWLETLDIRPRH